MMNIVNIDIWLNVHEYLPISAINNLSTLSTEYNHCIYQSELVWKLLLNRDFNKRQLSTRININDTTSYCQYMYLKKFYSTALRVTLNDFQLPDTSLKGVYETGIANISFIQQKSYLQMRSGLDVVVYCSDCTARTTACLLPLLSRIDTSIASTQLLMIYPTIQVATNHSIFIKKLSQFMNVNIQLFVNEANIKQLKDTPHIAIGTPKFINEMIRQQFLDTSTINTIFYDIFNKILDNGRGVVNNILRQVSNNIQICISTSRMSIEVQEFCSTCMKDPYYVEHDRKYGYNNFYVNVDKEEWKLEKLIDLMKTIAISQMIIFCNSKRKVDWLTQELITNSFTAVSIHGDKNAREREEAIREYGIGTSRILITTDRIYLVRSSLDRSYIPLIIYYDLPVTDYEQCSEKVINLITGTDIDTLHKFDEHYSLLTRELPNIHIADSI
jgi:superfamily II DNA/RNA helicase